MTASYDCPECGPAEIIEQVLELSCGHVVTWDPITGRESVTPSKRDPHGPGASRPR
jgi:hypothetical protein